MKYAIQDKLFIIMNGVMETICNRCYLLSGEDNFVSTEAFGATEALLADVSLALPDEADASDVCDDSCSDDEDAATSVCAWA